MSRVLNNRRGQAVRALVVLALAGVLASCASLETDTVDQEAQEAAIRRAAWKQIAAAEAEQPQFRVNLGHSGEVTSVAFSPDGALLLTGSDDGTARLWEVATGREIRAFYGHTGLVETVAYDPAGRYIATGGIDGTARVWAADTGEEVHSFSVDGDLVTAVAFSPDGRYLLTGGRLVGSLPRAYDEPFAATLWDLRSGERVRRYSGHDHNITAVSYSADGRFVATGSADNTVRIWNASTGEVTRSFSFEEEDKSVFDRGVTSLALTADGTNALVGLEDSTARLLDLQTGEAVLRLRANAASEFTSVAVSADGRFAVTGENDTMVTVWDLSNGGEVSRFTTYPDDDSRPATGVGVTSVAFSPKGDTVVVGSQDGTATLFGTTTGGILQTLRGYSEWVGGLAVSEGGEYVLTEREGLAILWDLERGRMVRSFADPSAFDAKVAFAGNIPYVLTQYNQSGHRLWNLATEQSIPVSGDYTSLALSFALSNDGRIGITGYLETTALLWDASNGQVLHQLGRHSSSVDAVAISPNGSYALTGSGDGGVRLWDVASGSEIRRFRGIDDRVLNVAFSPDGEYVLSESWGGTVKLWEVHSGREVRTFARSATSFAFSSDGRYMVTGSYDWTVRVWDVSTGEILHRLYGHVGTVSSVAFLPGDERVVSTGQDGTLRFWDIDSGSELLTGFATADGHYLTWTPDGYFAGDTDVVREAVYFVDGFTTISTDQFFEQYYRPDVIEARIAGRDVTPEATEEQLADTLLPLPRVQLEIERTDGSFSTLTPAGMAAAGVAEQAATAANNALSRLGGGAPVPISESNIRVEDGLLRLQIVAVDRGGGAEELRLFHNGARVSGETRGLGAERGGGSDAVVQEFAVPLVDGESVFRAVAFTRTEIESNPAIISLSYRSPQQLRPKLWLLAVGANEYQNSRYNLNYAVGDAQGFAEAAERSGRRLFSDIETTLILDEDVTRDRLLEAFESIADQARPQDVFMFFYAGHGIALQSQQTGNSEFFFIMHDVVQMTSIEQVERLGISGPEFQELVTSIPARKQFHVLDACNAGAINTAFGIRGAGEEIALSRMSRATGSALIAASRDDQFAQEFAALGQGALTRAVLDGLGGAARGDDDEITVGELKSYVENAVPGLTAEHTGQAQYPTGFVFGQDFPVGLD